MFVRFEKSGFRNEAKEPAHGARTGQVMRNGKRNLRLDSLTLARYFQVAAIGLLLLLPRPAAYSLVL